MQGAHLPRLLLFCAATAAAACTTSTGKVPVKEVQVQSSTAVAQSYAIDEPDVGGAEALTAEPVIQGSSLDAGADLLLGEILNGGEVYLSQFRGRVVVVNYWSSSCGPCGGRLRDLASISVDYQPWGLVVANVNTGDAPQAARNWLDANGLGDFSGLQLSDPSGRAAGGAGISGAPATLLFDKGGSEIMRYADDAPADLIRRDLELLLK